MDYRAHYETYRRLVDERLEELARTREPRSLYEPTDHILHGKGKRIRAVLVMLAAEAVGMAGREVLDAGLSVEVLHNFTLVHDDIMDRAATRRGRPTVHTKWDEGTAILVGDVMIGLAQLLLLEHAGDHCHDVLKAFAQGIVDVSEGQALDREYESRNDISVEEYLHMISMKTGRLAEMAAEIGAILGGGTTDQIEGMKAYARNIGLAFQIQDDLLDLTADEEKLGKEIGRDIIEGKRTYLVVRAIEQDWRGSDRDLLDRLLTGPGLPASDIPAAREAFDRHGILRDAASEVERYCNEAESCLRVLPESTGKEMLGWFAAMLTKRTS